MASNNNEGVLFPTKNVKKDDARCHYSGNAMILGVEYQLFGRRPKEDDTLRSVDFLTGPDKMATATLKPNPYKDNRQQSKRPDYVGMLSVQGKSFEIAGWTRKYQSKYGGEQKLLSMKITEKPPEEPTETVTGDDDDAPF